MKTPGKQNKISDYFIGVFPQAELDEMIDDCVKQVLEGDGTSDWETIFENKILVKQIQLEMKLSEAYESATGI